jgi:HlyD family secretion protein
MASGAPGDENARGGRAQEELTVSTESPRTPNIRELESLRIARTEKPARRRRLLPALIVLVVLGALGIAGYEVYLNTLGRPPEVQTAIVAVRQAGQPGVILTGSGYVVTEHKYIVIGTKILGQIVAEPIQEGQHVKVGDLLARIDDRDYEAQLNQAIADRDLAKANVDLTYAQLTRMGTLFRNGVSSRDQLDVARNAYEVAQAALKRAVAAIDFAKFNVSQCVIRSPINGIVLKKYREVGDTINYGGDIQAGGGTTDIVQLADTEDMRAEVDINESDISKVQMGGPATVIPDAYPDKSFDAKVVKIYPAADRQKGTVKVEVHIEHPDLAIIKPEMSAKITFVAHGPAKAQQPLVLVPKKAVIGSGATAAVWVVRDGIATKVPIALGREFQDGIEVKHGLDGGEMVIVVPPPKLKSGETVTPVAS